MEEINFTELKQQIESLLESRAKLHLENRLLHKKLSKITQERSLLLNTKDSVATKLKRLIKQLKEEIS